jgi:hypothetical protein
VCSFNGIIPQCKAARWMLLAFLSVSSMPISAQSAPAGKNSTDSQAAADASYQEEEPPEGELAPAAVKLDVSNATKLIQVLYAATRETKEQPTLDDLAQAKTLIDGGADVKALGDLRFELYQQIGPDCRL